MLFGASPNIGYEVGRNRYNFKQPFWTSHGRSRALAAHVGANLHVRVIVLLCEAFAIVGADFADFRTDAAGPGVKLRPAYIKSALVWQIWTQSCINRMWSGAA